MQRPLINYIRRPDTMDANAIGHLRQLAEQYPYFHSARVLMLHALYRNRHTDFDASLKQSAPLVPNCQSIFHLVEERNYSVEEERRKFTDEKPTQGDRTENLIDLFLQGLPDEPQPTHPQPVDATQDYIGYLMQTSSTDGDSQVLKGSRIIDTFLESGDTHISISRDENITPQGPQQRPTEDTNTPANSDFLTETLAGIYIRQGKYENAAKIIRQISLKNPQKSRYFADQLRFLDKLILNNKNK